MYINKPTQTDKYKLIPPLERWEYVTDREVPNVLPNMYMVSTYGRVSSNSKYIHNEEKLQSINYKDNGYLITKLMNTNRKYLNIYMHRLVLMKFNYIDGCENLDVNHIDGIKSHNWIWNLEWTTRSDNIKHALNTGLMGYGEDATGSKLLNEQVKTVCDMIESGIKLSDISKITNIPYNLVYDIFRCNTWFIISKDYNFTLSNAISKLSKEQIGLIYDNVPIMDIDSFMKSIVVDYDSLSETKKRIITNLVRRIEIEALKEKGSTTIP